MPVDPLTLTRFRPEAQLRLRAEIEAAGGIEVFAIGSLDAQGQIDDLDVHCRGNEGAVPALLTRPRPGQVVIHNHPSGVLQASGADMALAALYGDDGVGMVITDNLVARALWVVEPHRPKVALVDANDVRRFFVEQLPRAIDGFEPRSGQLDLALEINTTLNDGGVAALEAGTGTGKSLAYLAPAALWALANGQKVAIATYTIHLQGQLVGEDLAVLQRGGIDVRWALLKGRTNYLCRRRLIEAAESANPADPEGAVLRRLAVWAETAAEGSRSDLAFPVDPEVWEQVESDHDQTLRVRCPHYETCFYYQARRKAAEAHLLIVNHHLLLADLALKQQTGGDGILPRFDRVVLDEAHHLEDAATGLIQCRFSASATRRATAPLGPGRKAGAIAALRPRLTEGRMASELSETDRARAAQLLDRVEAAALRVHEAAPGWAQALAGLLSPDQPTLRITAEVERGAGWTDDAAPLCRQASAELNGLSTAIGHLLDLLDNLPPAVRLERPQPIFDLQRARRRLAEQAQVLAEVAEGADGRVRWIELERSRGRREPRAAALTAPVEVGPLLRARLFDPLRAVVMTSATLTVDGRFDHLLGRIGWPEADQRAGPRDDPATGFPLALEEQPWTPDAPADPLPVQRAWPSPFDYQRQGILGIPRDLPPPDAPGFLPTAADVIRRALRASDGGAFVLCTSFRMVEELHQRVEALLAADGGRPLVLMRQGALGRDRLLADFRTTGDAVLFGTDSFWEGVSVKGRALRLVIIPRLPFRVPTEPVQQARYERLQATGRDPFRGYALPQAVLRLRQGVGRLVRTQRDRGAVLILDRRVSERWYGRVFLQSLPPLRRVTGPSQAIIDALDALYAG